MEPNKTIDKESTLFLECSIGSARYLIDCAEIVEVIRLPKLDTAIREKKYLAGAINLRGEVLEVIDARRLLGHRLDYYKLSDRIVILKVEHTKLGILVQGSHHVIEVSPHQIQLSGKAPEREASGVIESVVCNPDGLLPIVSIPKIIAALDVLVTDNDTIQDFDEKITLEEREEFHLRASELMEVSQRSTSSSNGYAVIKILGEYYGIALEQVTEFLKVDQITPVPCCPAHIVGNANWRGELLTVIDVSSELNLSGVVERERPKVVVFGQKQEAVGVLVDEIYDICQLSDDEILMPPTSLKATTDGLLTGVAAHDGYTFGLLCMERLLARERWCVNDVV